MTDELAERRLSARAAHRRPARGAGPARPADPPRWVRTFVISGNAYEPCARHHHRCHGVNVLLDPVPDCPCDCGDPRNPLLLNARAWADLALHAPGQVWVAAMLERQRAAGIHKCTWRRDGSGLHAADATSR
ncbi:hypothetical protein ACF1AE_21295 [Streptomyces sp. NPDC014986]|uniref:hypothetical protein n=1 Tax=Streptomyces sp. NPDC014986 TaxID=3364934 RepID=UPI0036FB18B4